MTRSIRWRMVSIFVLLVVIVMIFSGTLIVYQTRKYEYDLIKEDLVATANAIHSAVDIDMPSSEIEAAFVNLMQDNEFSLASTYIYILDEKGGILHSGAPRTEEVRFNNAQVMAAISGLAIEEFDEVYLAGQTTSYIGYAKSVQKNGTVLFVIYVIASTAQVQEKIGNMVYVIAISVMLAIVMSIVLAFLFSAFLTRPITALTRKAREMSKGELKNPIEVLSQDEIGELTTNFNTMATSLNRTLAEIANEKTKMETVIAHMTDGIMVFGNYGLVMHYNPAAVRMLKLKEFQSYKDVFAKIFDMNFEKLMLQVEKGLTKRTIHIDDAYYNVNFAQYLDQTGQVQGVISVVQDITEHKKLEAMQKDFVANVSHELRTPLTTIKSYAETLLEGAVEDLGLANQFLGVINKESDRMTALVQDLLELSKLDNQRNSMQMVELEISEILRTVVSNYQIHAYKKNQRLTYFTNLDSAIVMGDANRIEQVFKNILSNAVKYSGEDAAINVRLILEKNEYLIEVSDTGMGIPPEDVEHIFDRFYRVDKARSRAMGGTGLGLAIAKEIMTLHGGDIRVESEVEVGTKFYLYFPVKYNS